jgi:hypothetical protein
MSDPESPSFQRCTKVQYIRYLLTLTHQIENNFFHTFILYSRKYKKHKASTLKFYKENFLFGFHSFIINYIMR